MLFCRHQWETTNTYTEPSILDRAAEAGLEVDVNPTGARTFTSLLTRTRVIEQHCPKCGKARIVSERV